MDLECCRCVRVYVRHWWVNQRPRARFAKPRPWANPPVSCSSGPFHIGGPVAGFKLHCRSPMLVGLSTVDYGLLAAVFVDPAELIGCFWGSRSPYNRQLWGRSGPRRLQKGAVLRTPSLCSGFAAVWGRSDNPNIDGFRGRSTPKDIQ